MYMKFPSKRILNCNVCFYTTWWPNNKRIQIFAERWTDIFQEIFHVQFYVIIICKYFIVVDLYIIFIQYVDIIKMYLVVEAEASLGWDGIAIKLQAVADKRQQVIVKTRW